MRKVNKTKSEFKEDHIYRKLHFTSYFYEDVNKSSQQLKTIYYGKWFSELVLESTPLQYKPQI